MTLELTIQEMFEKYPTLYKERSDCLDHLFCCIGNGYEWNNGELVYIGRSKDKLGKRYLKSRLINGKAFQHNKMSLRDEAAFYLKQNILDQCGEQEVTPEIQEIIDKRATDWLSKYPDNVYHKRERKYRWYFYLSGYSTNYSKLFNYPTDIKPDWLAGIEECKAMLIEDGYDVEHPNEHPIDTKANWEECIAAHKKREWMVK